MGEYANEEVDRLLNEGTDPIETVFRPGNGKPEPAKYSIRGVKRETQLAWQVIMSGGALRWFPKKHCILDLENKEVIVPAWLDKKMWDAEWDSMDHENQFIKPIAAQDGVWNTSEHKYRDRLILIKSRTGHGMKAHAMYPNSDKVQFTLRYLFIDPAKLLEKVKNKIDKIDGTQ